VIEHLRRRGDRGAWKLLRELAFELLAAGQRGRADRGVAVEALRRLRKDELTTNTEAGERLRELEEMSGLLEAPRGKEVAFRHLTFQEYLVAEELWNRWASPDEALASWVAALSRRSGRSSSA
jgi:predicted NACHT family NTPase